MAHGNNQDGRFPTTEWTLIARLRNDDTAVSTRALDELCSQYHFPLYCFIRRRGLAHHDAQDTLHDFLAKLLRLDAFNDLAAAKGRLRTFLSKALDRFLINRHHHERKRNERQVSVDETHFALDPKLEQRYQREMASVKDTPDVVFDRQWSEQMIQRVLALLEADYAAKGKAPLFAALRPVLLAGGSLRGHDSDDLASSLGMKPGTLRLALLRLLRACREVLVNEVRQTVASKDDVEAEIADLMKALAGAR